MRQPYAFIAFLRLLGRGLPLLIFGTIALTFAPPSRATQQTQPIAWWWVHSGPQGLGDCGPFQTWGGNPLDTTPDAPGACLCALQSWRTVWTGVMYPVNNPSYKNMQSCEGRDTVDGHISPAAAFIWQDPFCPPGYVLAYAITICLATGPDPDKNKGCPVTSCGNPINPANGNKFQRENDHVPTIPSRLRFERAYNSMKPLQPVAMGPMWLSNYDSRVVMRVGTDGTSLSVTRPDGKAYLFTLVGGNWLADSDVTDRVTRLVDGSGNFIGWQYMSGDTDDVWLYDINGRPTSITTRTAYVQSMAYGANNLLASVIDSFGRALVFAYDASNRVQTATDPASLIYRYGYDANNNLTTVTYPDTKIRQYIYDAPSLTNALTGIVDENGVRFATWTYDSSGRAITSQYSGGANLTSVTLYGSGTTTVRDATGTSTNYGFSSFSGVYKNTSLSVPCAGCGLAAAGTFDANANVLSRKDFITPTAKMTCYAYDTNRNLETARAEGILSTETCSTVLATLPARADVRKISTQWHAIWRLPAKIAEPNRITTNAYNGDGGIFCAPVGALVAGIPIGVLCKKTVQETIDATGHQGVGETTSGTPRVLQYTYDQFG
jgi:YD repeat-containing protein